MSRTRRAFLRDAGITAGGLLFAFDLGACKTTENVGSPGDFKPNAWVTVRSDGKVVFVLDRTEMGQGVMTSHAMLVAEELDLAPEDMEIEHAGADRKYDNPDLGLQATGGSTSVHGSWEPLRQAGAVVREALAGAAAASLGVARAELRAEKGAFIHDASGRRVGYGECAATAHRYVNEDAQPKAFDKLAIVGHTQQRVDVPAKVEGSAVFGIDVSVPNALTAVIVRCPVFGGSAKSIDVEAAKASPGVHSVVPMDEGVAVLADGYWRARQAANLIQAQWNETSLSTAEVRKLFARALDRPGLIGAYQGDPKDALRRAERFIDAEFELPYLAHATMEPMNCTADVRDGRCEVWAPTQSPAAAKQVAAMACGLPGEDVLIHATFVGGGFGRRINQDFVREAVLLSKEVKRPVQVIWSREDDIRHDFYRPGSLHRIYVGARGGQPSGWVHRVAAPSVLGHMVPGFMSAMMPGMPRFMTNMAGALFEGRMTDPSAVEGAQDMPYAIADKKVEWCWADPQVPLGFWRSVGHSFNAFVVETMVDELAELCGRDPVEMRRALLAQHPRHLGVLELAAAKAGWGSPLEKGRARGVAVHESFRSWVAEVVEASIEDGAIKVHKVTAAVDCGRTINPEVVRQQVEGAIIFGLSAALKQRITFEGGKVVEGNFNDYPLVRMFESPEIEVHVIESDAPPTGIGEPGVPPVAPALGNALRKLTGKPFRSLPLTLA